MAKPTAIWSLIKQTVSDFNQDNAMRLAAAMACYIILALAPMLVITIKVLGVVFGERTNDVVRAQLDQLIGPAGGDAIGQMIENANKDGGGTLATVVSLAIVVFSASGVFVSLQDALNTIWEVKPKPDAGWGQWLRKRFLSIGMVFGLAILLMTSMLVTAVLHVILDAVFGAERTGFLANAGAYALDFIVTVAVAWALFMAIFKILPDAKVAWSDVWFGALVTAVLFKVGQVIMAIYFAKGAATSAYGTFGSIVAVLLWAYYSSIILFAGAEFTQVWATAHGREIKPEAHATRVTDAERAQQGIPSRERLTAMPVRQHTQPVRQETASPLRTVGVAAGGALVAGLATWFLSRRQPMPERLAERINAVEAKVGKVSRLKRDLQHVDVKERIERVADEVRTLVSPRRKSERFFAIPKALRCASRRNGWFTS